MLDQRRDPEVFVNVIEITSDDVNCLIVVNELARGSSFAHLLSCSALFERVRREGIPTICIEEG